MERRLEHSVGYDVSLQAGGKLRFDARPAFRNPAESLSKRRTGNALILFVLVLLTFGCDRELFTDDFESYSVGSMPAAPWQKTGEGTAIVDDSRSVSGRKSVHFRSGEGYKDRSILSFSSPRVFPLKKNRYYGRMVMFVESASPDGVHWTMLESSGKVPGKGISAEIRYGGQHSEQLMANYETWGAKTDCWQHSTVKIPEQRWFSVSWMLDGGGNEMKIWIDNNLIDEITVKGRGQGCLGNDLNGDWLFPVFENVQIGWVDYQMNGGERNIWIDDFAISSRPIKR
ncbi:MAG: hypothetical protein ABIR33_12670 [Pyrinomonadaceae bacterium]